MSLRRNGARTLGRFSRQAVFGGLVAGLVTIGLWVGASVPARADVHLTGTLSSSVAYDVTVPNPPGVQTTEYEHSFSLDLSLDSPFPDIASDDGTTTVAAVEKGWTTYPTCGRVGVEGSYSGNFSAGAVTITDPLPSQVEYNPPLHMVPVPGSKDFVDLYIPQVWASNAVGNGICNGPEGPTTDAISWGAGGEVPQAMYEEWGGPFGGANWDGGKVVGKVLRNPDGSVASYDFNVTFPHAFGCYASVSLCEETIHGELKPAKVPISVSAGGPYDVTRASPVTLTANVTPSDEPITGYEWTFKPKELTAEPDKECPSGTTLTNSKMSGQSVTFSPLCSLLVSLHVEAADGATGDATTEVTVDPRREVMFAQTPITNEMQEGTKNLDPRTPEWEPTVQKLGTADLGVNWSACTDSTNPERLFCPSQNPAVPRQPGEGYEIGTLSDPGGPFDGFSYVTSSDLSIQQIVLIDPYFEKDGDKIKGAPGGRNWYAFNRKKGASPDGFLTGLEEHEGMGPPGHPDEGHTGAIVAAVQADESLDPRHIVEKEFAPTSSQLIKNVGGALSADETILYKDSLKPDEGPVVPTWQGNLWFWNTVLRKWERFLCLVGKPAAPCFFNP